MDALLCHLDQTFQIFHLFHIVQQLGCQQIRRFFNIYAYFLPKQIKQWIPPENNAEKLNQ